MINVLVCVTYKKYADKLTCFNPTLKTLFIYDENTKLTLFDVGFTRCFAPTTYFRIIPKFLQLS